MESLERLVGTSPENLFLSMALRDEREGRYGKRNVSKGYRSVSGGRNRGYKSVSWKRKVSKGYRSVSGKRKASGVTEEWCW